MIAIFMHNTKKTVALIHIQNIENIICQRVLKGCRPQHLQNQQSGGRVSEWRQYFVLPVFVCIVQFLAQVIMEIEIYLCHSRDIRKHYYLGVLNVINN